MMDDGCRDEKDGRERRREGHMGGMNERMG